MGPGTSHPKGSSVLRRPSLGITCATVPVTRLHLHLTQRCIPGWGLRADEVLQVGHAHHHAPVSCAQRRGLSRTQLPCCGPPWADQHARVPGSKQHLRDSHSHPGTPQALPTSWGRLETAPEGASTGREEGNRQTPAARLRELELGDTRTEGHKTTGTQTGEAKGRALRSGNSLIGVSCWCSPKPTRVPVLLGLRIQLHLGKGIHLPAEPGFQEGVKHVGVQDLQGIRWRSAHTSLDPSPVETHRPSTQSSRAPEPKHPELSSPT